LDVFLLDVRSIVHEPKNTGLVNVYSDGQTDYFQLLTYQSTCALNMQRFPFDEQNCTFVFSSWAYMDDALTVDFYHNEGFTNDVDWTAFTPSSDWDVVSSGAYRNSITTGGYFNYKNLTYHIIIRRRPGFYLYVLIIPSLLLSILTPGLFWIPPSRPDRTTLGE
jgi:nicotinic acetylcholine receptor